MLSPVPRSAREPAEDLRHVARHRVPAHDPSELPATMHEKDAVLQDPQWEWMSENRMGGHAAPFSLRGCPAAHSMPTLAMRCGHQVSSLRNANSY